MAYERRKCFRGHLGESVQDSVPRTDAPLLGDDRLVARVSQQDLADAVGSVREVVARVLRDFRVAGIVATAADTVVILDAARLHAETAGPAGL